jgi:hypothetical protein
MQLEWVTDAAFRFFSTQPDELFGYVLHPVDLATNKAAAAADRRVPRDIVDLVTIHENILPLGAVLSAAVGKFPGVTPEEMLAERAVQPDVNALDKYQRNPGAPSGFWPTSPEISRAMLERYGKPKPTSK